MGAACCRKVESSTASPSETCPSDEANIVVSITEEAGPTSQLHLPLDASDFGACLIGGASTPSTQTFAGGTHQLPSEDLTDTEGERSEPLTMWPIGNGGMAGSSADMTDEMLRLKNDTIELFKRQTHSEMTPFNLDYLTPMTLQNYLTPFYAPDLLMKACQHRAHMEDKLEGRVAIRLNGSCRIVGWDAQGRTIVAHEPCTMRAPLSEFLDHFEYIFWNALDLNKPGANGVVVVLNVAGGYNWRHFISMHAIFETASLLKNCFHGRLAALYMVDMPSAFQGVYNSVAKFAEKDTRERIKTISGSEALIKELSGLGVDSDTIDYFRKYMVRQLNAKAQQMWFPLADIPFFREKLGEVGACPKTEHITLDHHTKFRGAMQQLRMQKWGC